MALHVDYPHEAFHMLDHLKPSIRISPFSSNHLKSVIDKEAVNSEALVPEYWLDNGQYLGFLNSGRDALKAVLNDIGLLSHDNVLIVTTSQGSYISSCVTNIIDSKCEWTRVVNKRTKAVLIIHEFGFPCSITDEVKNMGLPIIEDCAYATGSRILGAAIGKYGDYAIYSIPKYFPVPFGGIVVSRTMMNPSEGGLKISVGGVHYLKSMLSKMILKCHEWNQIRKSNWYFFQESLLEKHEIKPYFDMQENISPGVYVLKLPLKDMGVGSNLKDMFVNLGIEATEYYGQGGFYFPVHQYLSDYEKQLICYQFEKGISVK